MLTGPPRRAPVPRGHPRIALGRLGHAAAPPRAHLFPHTVSLTIAFLRDLRGEPRPRADRMDFPARLSGRQPGGGRRIAATFASLVEDAPMGQTTASRRGTAQPGAGPAARPVLGLPHARARPSSPTPLRLRRPRLAEWRLVDDLFAPAGHRHPERLESSYARQRRQPTLLGCRRFIPCSPDPPSGRSRLWPFETGWTVVSKASSMPSLAKPGRSRRAALPVKDARQVAAARDWRSS